MRVHKSPSAFPTSDTLKIINSINNKIMNYEKPNLEEMDLIIEGSFLNDFSVPVDNKNPWEGGF